MDEETKKMLQNMGNPNAPHVQSGLAKEKLPPLGKPVKNPANEARIQVETPERRASEEEETIKLKGVLSLGNYKVTQSKNAPQQGQESLKTDLAPKSSQKGTTEKPEYAKEMEEAKLVEFVERFKTDLTDIKDKLDKEQRSYYIREYSRQLSEQMYSTVIKWNQELRQRLPQEENRILTLLREKFKPFINYKGFILPFVCSSKLNQDFLVKEELDWSRRLYFLTKIDILQTEQFDPIHRQLIRENNLRLFASLNKDLTLDQIVKRLIDTESPRLYLLAMQHGLIIDTADMSKMIQKLSGKLKQLFLYTRNFKRQTKVEENGNKFSSLSNGKTREDGVELLEEEGEKILMGLDKFIGVNQRSDIERASDVLKFLMHCIVLHNDVAFTTNIKAAKAGETKPRSSYFVDSKILFKEIKSTLFDSLVADNFECLLGLKEEAVLHMVMEITTCIVGDCHDFYGRSLKLFRDSSSLNKTDYFQDTSILENVLFNDPKKPVKLPEDNVRRVHDFIIEIVEGRRGKFEFYNDQELKTQLIEFLSSLKEEIVVTNRANPKLERVCRMLAVLNMIHLLLNLAAMFTASKGPSKAEQARNPAVDSSKQIIHLCLGIVRQIMSHYPAAKCMIFSSKEWFFLQRLYQFYPCDCLSLIHEAIQDNQAIFLASEPKAQMVIDFLLDQIRFELPKVIQYMKEYEDQSADLVKSITIWTKKFIKEIPSKRENIEEEVSIILMFKCLRTLFSEKTNQLLNRKYCVGIQRSCLNWLRQFVWDFLLKFKVENSQKMTFFRVELRSEQEIQKFIADLGNSEIDLDSKSIVLEICYSILLTLNTTCLYGRIFNSEELGDSFKDALTTKDSQVLSFRLSTFYSLMNFLEGGLILAEISKLISHVNILEFTKVKQDYSTVDFHKEVDQIRDSIMICLEDTQFLLSHFDDFVDAIEGRDTNPFLDSFTMRAIFEPVHKLINGVRSVMMIINDDKITDHLMEALCELLLRLGLLDQKAETMFAEEHRYFYKKYPLKEFGIQLNAIKHLLEKNAASPGRKPVSTDRIKPRSELKRITYLNKPEDKKAILSQIIGSPYAFLGKVVFSVESAICGLKTPYIEKEYQYFMTETIQNLQDQASTILIDLPDDGTWNLACYRDKIARCIEVTKSEYKVIDDETVTTEGDERVSLLRSSKRVALIDQA
jgi:hypothetical protein